MLHNFVSDFHPEEGCWIISFETGGLGYGQAKTPVTLWPYDQFIIHTEEQEAYEILEFENEAKLPYTRGQLNEVKSHIRNNRRGFQTLDELELQHWAWIGVQAAKNACISRGITIPEKAPCKVIEPQPSAAGAQPSRSSPQRQTPEGFHSRHPSNSPSITTAAAALLQLTDEEARNRAARILMDIHRSDNGGTR